MQNGLNLLNPCWIGFQMWEFIMVESVLIVNLVSLFKALKMVG